MQKYFLINEKALKYQEQMKNIFKYSDDIAKNYNLLIQNDNIQRIKEILLKTGIKKEELNQIEDDILYSLFNHIILIKIFRNPFLNILYRYSGFFYNKIISFDFFKIDTKEFCNYFFYNLNKENYILIYKIDETKECFLYPFFNAVKNFYLFYFSIIKKEEDSTTEILSNITNEEIFIVFCAFAIYKKQQETNISICSFLKTIKNKFDNDTIEQICFIVNFLKNISNTQINNKKKTALSFY
jgi:hypothetical protein